MKFVIMSVTDNSGGVIVRENLCRILRELGYNAKIIVPQTGADKKWKKKNYYAWYIKYFFKKVIKEAFKKTLFNVKGCKLKIFPFVDKKTIVIYPQIIDNPLKAKNVVRWFLYYNQNKGDPTAYGKDDLFFTFREAFNDYDLNPTCRTLYTPYYDFDLYKRTNYGERSGKCYIIRKGREREDLQKEFDGPIIDDLSEEEKVKIFNQCEYCISYDTQCGYSQIAAMCGCISVVVPEQGKSRRDYLKEDDVVYGVAYGFLEEEISYAISTRDKAKEELENRNLRAKQQVENFVKVCKEYFKL